ncbi:MAG: metal-dependent hydrolase [Deltaproteobacteria bacterium]|jgi:L-ascorbate metabolism protein UlaG (beta-lactamase superfamily)|nr:metal-dependent hydrolase [Deltaproteobacteria bacterium]
MSVNVTWHGHANFQIESQGVNILIDPFFTGNPRAGLAWDQAPRPDVVLVTHLHGDHAGDAVDLCRKYGAKLGTVVGAGEKLMEAGVPQAQIIGGGGFNIGGTVEHGGVKFTMTEAFHTSESGAPVGFIITLQDGFTIYHAGDTGIFRNMKTWGELYSIDLALLPCGGFYTMDARQAALAAAYLKAAVAVPMHWGTFPVLIQDPKAFAAEVAASAPDCSPLLMRPGETASFDR